MRAPTYAVIAGGGTAGHVLPALAIGDAMVRSGHDPGAVHFVGSSRGIEASLVPEAGFGITLLPGRGIQRRLTFDNVGAAWGLVRAFARAVRLLGQLRPRVVVAMGGYASVACALAAIVRRVPIVVAEQNAVPGAANRLIARFARAAAVSFEGTALPRAVTTGNPVRAEVLAAASVDRTEAKRHFGIDPGRTLVVVVGGSLGALRLNQAVVDALGRWANRADLAVHHVIGRRDWEVVQAATPALSSSPLLYRPVAYELDMATALRAADVVVARAGSSTCFEIAAVGAAAVLVPSPHVTGDHQSANARHFADAGAAVVVPDAELDGERLADEVDALVADAGRRADLGARAAALARPDAAGAVAALAEAHARG